MTKSSKRVCSILVVALVSAAGVVLYQQQSVAAVQSAVERKADAVAHAYRSIAEAAVFPSENSRALSQDQRRDAGRVRVSYSRLSQPLSVYDKVQAITDLQVSLSAYLLHSLSVPGFASSPVIAHLTQELGPAGPVVPLLDDYNVAAKQWNDLRGTLSGRLRGQIAGEDELLPYLRFDGQQEYIRIVEL